MRRAPGVLSQSCRPSCPRPPTSHVAFGEPRAGRRRAAPATPPTGYRTGTQAAPRRDTRHSPRLSNGDVGTGWGERMGTSTGRRWRAVYLLVVASLLLTACAAADRAVHGGFTDGTFPYVSFPYTPLWGPGTYQTTIDGDDDELDFRPASTSDPTIRVTSSTFWPPGIPDPIRDGKVAP